MHLRSNSAWLCALWLCLEERPPPFARWKARPLAPAEPLERTPVSLARECCASTAPRSLEMRVSGRAAAARCSSSARLQPPPARGGKKGAPASCSSWVSPQWPLRAAHSLLPALLRPPELAGTRRDGLPPAQSRRHRRKGRRRAVPPPRRDSQLVEHPPLSVPILSCSGGRQQGFGDAAGLRRGQRALAAQRHPRAGVRGGGRGVAARHCGRPEAGEEESTPSRVKRRAGLSY